MQAATDGHLYDLWLDNAAMAKDRRIASHLQTAPNVFDFERESVESRSPRAW